MIRKGFTVIELIVAISIILILLGSAAFTIDHALKNERDAKRIGDAIAISKAVDQSVTVSHGTYPRRVGNTGSDATTHHFCAQDLVNTSNSNALALNLFTGSAFPTDPSPSASDNKC